MIESLDNAQVLYLSDKDDFGSIRYTDDSLPPIKVCYLAICKYDTDFTIYSFLLDENMLVQQDNIFDSIEEALADGRDRNENIAWNRRIFQTEKII